MMVVVVVVTVPVYGISMRDNPNNNSVIAYECGDNNHNGVGGGGGTVMVVVIAAVLHN